VEVLYLGDSILLRDDILDRSAVYSSSLDSIMSYHSVGYEVQYYRDRLGKPERIVSKGSSSADWRIRRRGDGSMQIETYDHWGTDFRREFYSYDGRIDSVVEITGSERVVLHKILYDASGLPTSIVSYDVQNNLEAEVDSFEYDHGEIVREVVIDFPRGGHPTVVVDQRFLAVSMLTLQGTVQIFDPSSRTKRVGFWKGEKFICTSVTRYNRYFVPVFEEDFGSTMADHRVTQYFWR
jgi:hypothetical protein